MGIITTDLDKKYFLARLIPLEFSILTRPTLLIKYQKSSIQGDGPTRAIPFRAKRNTNDSDRREEGAMKKLAKKITTKDEAVVLRREMAKAKKEWDAKNRKLESQAKSQEKDIQRRRGEIEILKAQLKKRAKDLSEVKKESTSKVKESESKVQEMTI